MRFTYDGYTLAVIGGILLGRALSSLITYIRIIFCTITAIENLLGRLNRSIYASHTMVRNATEKDFRGSKYNKMETLVNQNNTGVFSAT